MSPSLTKFEVDYSDPLHTSFDVVNVAEARPGIHLLVFSNLFIKKLNATKILFLI